MNDNHKTIGLLALATIALLLAQNLIANYRINRLETRQREQLRFIATNTHILQIQAHMLTNLFWRMGVVEGSIPNGQQWPWPPSFQTLPNSPGTLEQYP